MITVLKKITHFISLGTLLKAAVILIVFGLEFSVVQAQMPASETSPKKEKPALKPNSRDMHVVVRDNSFQRMNIQRKQAMQMKLQEMRKQRMIRNKVDQTRRQEMIQRKNQMIRQRNIKRR